MGAALLSTPDLLLDILRKLLDAIPLPISCKIRMLPEQDPTLVLAARILRTGIRNLTVHCRTRDMRPGDRAMWERLGDVVELGKRRGVPIICNGDGEGWANWDRIRSETSASGTRNLTDPDCDSVMIARAAERNPSIFLPAGPRSNITEVIPRLLNIAQHVNNPWGNTKFLLNQFKPSPPPISNWSKTDKKAAQEAISRSKSLEEVAEKLQIKLGGGLALMAEIEDKIGARPSDAFVARQEAKDGGQVMDESDLIRHQGEVDEGSISV